MSDESQRPLSLAAFMLASPAAVKLAVRLETTRAVWLAHEFTPEEVDAGIAEAMERARTRGQGLDYWLDELNARWLAELRWRVG